jgi:hypothetical protein
MKKIRLKKMNENYLQDKIVLENKMEAIEKISNILFNCDLAEEFKKELANAKENDDICDVAYNIYNNLQKEHENKYETF